MLKRESVANRSLTLYCLPCAGASATMYMRWRRLLPAWINVEPLELPGRGIRLDEGPSRNYDALVASLVQGFSPAGAYALLGHSMGALLAYGMTLSLRKQGMPLPLALLLSASPAPSRLDRSRYENRDDRAALLDDMRRQGGTSPVVFESPELLDMTLSLLAADYAVCASFSGQNSVSLNIPIHVFGGEADEIHASRIQAWRAETSLRFTEDWFAGGHFFLRQQEEAFLRQVSLRLTESCMLSDVRDATAAPA